MKLLQPLMLALSCAIFSSFAAADVSEQEVRQAMGTLQQKLPIVLDSSSKLVGVSVLPGRMVVYQYSVDTEVILRTTASNMGMSYQQFLQKATQKFGSPFELVKASIPTKARPGLVQQNCSMPFTHQMMRDGWSLIHQLDAIDGQHLSTEIVALKDCGGL